MRGCAKVPCKKMTNAAAMRCEHYMRGILLREIIAAGAKQTDNIVSGDVDEIPRPEFLRPLRDCNVFGPTSNLETHPTAIIMLAKMYMYAPTPQA